MNFVDPKIHRCRYTPWVNSGSDACGLKAVVRVQSMRQFSNDNRRSAMITTGSMRLRASDLMANYNALPCTDRVPSICLSELLRSVGTVCMGNWGRFGRDFRGLAPFLTGKR